MRLCPTLSSQGVFGGEHGLFGENMDIDLGGLGVTCSHINNPQGVSFTDGLAVPIIGNKNAIYMLPNSENEPTKFLANSRKKNQKTINQSPVPRLS